MTTPTERSAWFARRHANGREEHQVSRPPDFACQVTPERDRVRVAPIGELDMATTPRLEASVRELREAGFDHVILDLGRLSFIDSTGLRLILTLDAAARADALHLELLPGPPEVQRIFEITDTTSRLPFRTNGRARPHADPRKPPSA